MTNKINGIDLSEYFKNHYDNSGKLYATEYKGNPLELQNAIKRLQEENKELYEKNVRLKKRIEKLKKKNDEYFVMNLKYEIKIDDLTQALEEIRDVVSDEIDKIDTDDELMQIYGTINNKCNEVLNDRD